MFDDKTKIQFYSLDPPEWNGYLVAVDVSTFENELFCERARRDDKPIIVGDENIVFVQRDFVGKDFTEEDYVPKLYFGFTISE